MSKRYLYGAAVQGIQDFIFATGKLREIAGASEFVESVCTTIFEEALGRPLDDQERIINAAGNIRCILNEEDCRKVVRNFPFQVGKQAPGLTISQAVVPFEGEFDKTPFDTLQKNLDTQRNKPKATFRTAWMAAERSRRTGMAAEGKEGGDYLSREELLKRNDADHTRLATYFTDSEWIPAGIFPTDIEKITGKDDAKDGWMAVIHADGNGLGSQIISMMKDPNLAGKELIETYRDFSLKLDEATKHAAKDAFYNAFGYIESYSSRKPIPMRPILLGGDDLTIIIKADKALEFTRCFMQAFEEETVKAFADIKYEPIKSGLTICAGIAYIKPNYPFHYAVKLADDLCKHAKKIAKNIDANRPPSCLMFHQVYSSFIGGYTEMAERELSSTSGRFDFGPYFINLTHKGDHWSVAELQCNYRRLQKDKSQDRRPESQEHNSLKSRLRQLITLYTDGEIDAAKQDFDRIKTLKGCDEKLFELGMHDSIFTRGKYSPALDLINMANLHQEEPTHKKQTEPA